MHEYSNALPQDHAIGTDHHRYRTARSKSVYPTLCKVGESESDNDGCNGALSGTDDLAHVDRDLTVRRLGRDNSTVHGSRGMPISDEGVSVAVR